MELGIQYQGRVATSQDIAFIKKVIAANPQDSRRALSQKICKTWNWVQPNGALRDMVCRGFMLRLDSAGHITLPPQKFTPNNSLVNRKKPVRIKIDESPNASGIEAVTLTSNRQFLTLLKASREFGSLNVGHF